MPLAARHLGPRSPTSFMSLPLRSHSWSRTYFIALAVLLDDLFAVLASGSLSNPHHHPCCCPPSGECRHCRSPRPWGPNSESPHAHGPSRLRLCDASDYGSSYPRPCSSDVRNGGEYPEFSVVFPFTVSLVWRLSMCIPDAPARIALALCGSRSWHCPRAAQEHRKDQGRAQQARLPLATSSSLHLLQGGAHLLHLALLVVGEVDVRLDAPHGADLPIVHPRGA